MKSLAVILVSIVGFTACSDSPVAVLKATPKVSDDLNSKDTIEDKNLGETVVPVNTAPKNDEPNIAVAGDPYEKLTKTAFLVEGVPKDSSDLYNFEFKVTADPSITHFSYKIGSPEDCKIGSGHQVEPISSVIKVNIDLLPDGPVAVCLLKYLASDELWLRAEDSIVQSWTKAPFVRSIKSQYEEYDYDCRKNITTVTEVKFSGTTGTYTWSRDAKAQGCNQAKTEGEDKLSITSSDKSEIKGFWSYEGEDASGWYAFKWKDELRTSFEGVFGYGDPSLAPSGPWNSTSP